MKLKDIYNIRKNYLIKKHNYVFRYYKNFNYNILNLVLFRYPTGRGKRKSYNDCIIMADTETSKKLNSEENHVVAWSISIRAYNINICTLWGKKPSEFIDCLNKIKNNLNGDILYIYFHNLTYDWTFLEKFLINEYGVPTSQLNTKSHYPINIRFSNGLHIKDSLILAQRSLEKWAIDLNVEHKKSTGNWDYNKIRNQSEYLTLDELEYIEHDVLSGVECIDKTCEQLNCNINTIPYTATGIIRREIQKIGKNNKGHEFFTKLSADYDFQQILEKVYHGGFTHANRDFIDCEIIGTVDAYDFSSSYPFTLLSEKFPCEKFTQIDFTYNEILESSEDYAFIFKLVLIKPKIKKGVQMPTLQYSKCEKSINVVLDNGRVLCAEYVEIYTNEIDFQIIYNSYECEKIYAFNVMCAKKDYLPRWLTDYVYNLYINKTTLNGVDDILYILSKYKINSVYGLMVTKPIKLIIEENYLTGEFKEKENQEPQKIYDKYLNKKDNCLPYVWGVYVTSYAFRNLMHLGSLCETWIYSDTDSCYGINWNIGKIEEYNNNCKKKLLSRGYGGVMHNGKEYWLGIAEFDGEYSEFRVMGAKRYCGRSTKDNKLHITIAGCPKKGSDCLNDDINNFTKSAIFSGTITGKLQHKYIYVDNIYIDENGNETGNSIDLSSCDYLLDSIDVVDWEKIYNEEIKIINYENNKE